MRLNKITNPIYFELLKLQLINKKNIIKISNKCRDKKIAVYQDKIKKIIFLEKYSFNKKKYFNYRNKFKKLFGKIYKKIDVNKKKYIEKLNDDKRRVIQFKKLCKNKEILDFGCGWGDFLIQLKNTKKKYAYEIRNECLKNLKQNKINIIKNINVFNKKVDIITMFHVLEHLPSQINTLKILKEKLKHNGKIIIEIPHANDVLISKIKLKKFFDFTFISEHLILHTSGSIKKILFKAGFKNIKIKYFQRHNLNNFLSWIINGKPGGHNNFKISSKQSLIKFEEYLIKHKITDTLIITAEK